MATPNVGLLVDQHILDALNEARAEADDLMARYIERRRTIAELEAMTDLRTAMGAELRPALVKKSEAAA